MSSTDCESSDSEVLVLELHPTTPQTPRAKDKEVRRKPLDPFLAQTSATNVLFPPMPDMIPSSPPALSMRSELEDKKQGKKTLQSKAKPEPKIKLSAAETTHILAGINASFEIPSIEAVLTSKSLGVWHVYEEADDRVEIYEENAEKKAKGVAAKASLEEAIQWESQRSSVKKEVGSGSGCRRQPQGAQVREEGESGKGDEDQSSQGE